MRFSNLLMAAATAATLAWSAAAQQAPAEPQAKAEGERPRLPEISDVLDGMADAETPAAPTAEETAPVSAPAPAAPARARPISAEQRAAIDLAVQRGRALAALAQAGMLATQDMLARIADPEGAGISGWVAEPEGNALAVTFYANTDAGPVAVHRARALGGRIVSRDVFPAGARPPLSPVLARMAGARDATETLDHRPCTGDAFNVLVLPPESASAPVLVYQLTPAADSARVPLGGHFRSSVGADGAVGESRGFTNACLEAAVPPAAAGEQPQPLALTHLLDSTPTEVHVFLSLWTGRPLLVATGTAESGEAERVWFVTGERIAELRP